MKKILIILAALFGIANYLSNRKKTSKSIKRPLRSHHLTNAFSKAKQHAADA